MFQLSWDEQLSLPYYLDEQKVLKKLRLLLEHPMLNQLSYESVFKTNSIHNVLESWQKKFDQS